jgi:hypothetical protein
MQIISVDMIDCVEIRCDLRTCGNDDRLILIDKNEWVGVEIKDPVSSLMFLSEERHVKSDKKKLPLGQS